MEIKAKKITHLSSEKIPQLFQLISENPKLYKMDSHEGFKVIEGSLTKVGSIFTTKEKFAGITIKLEFEVTKVDPEKSFEFKLRNITKGRIKGRFKYKKESKDKVCLILRIFNNPSNNFLQNLSVLPIFLFPTRNIVKKQITKEIAMIKRIAEDN